MITKRTVVIMFQYIHVTMIWYITKTNTALYVNYISTFKRKKKGRIPQRRRRRKKLATASPEVPVMEGGVSLGSRWGPKQNQTTLALTGGQSIPLPGTICPTSLVHRCEYGGIAQARVENLGQPRIYANKGHVIVNLTVDLPGPCSPDIWSHIILDVSVEVFLDVVYI